MRSILQQLPAGECVKCEAKQVEPEREDGAPERGDHRFPSVRSLESIARVQKIGPCRDIECPPVFVDIRSRGCQI